VAIPDFQAVMRPLLVACADGEPKRLSDLELLVADTFNLTEAERLQLQPSGKQAVFENRLRWAATYLFKAGLLSRPEKGFVRITPTGQQVLQSHPTRVDNKVLMEFESFREFKKLTETGSSNPQPTVIANALIDQSTPEETLETAWQTLRENTEQELLNRIKGSSPKFFERLVLDLLVKMGYGGSRYDAAQVLGSSGDAGVDGVIKEDRLGLDLVYVQAKRWDGPVGRPVVQAFAGSLEGQRARKGVLITTSNFTQDAWHYIDQIEKRIVLIDGVQLARLMIEHDVGTLTYQRYALKRIDSEYFDEGLSLPE
jgi:restriction system protein